MNKKNIKIACLIILLIILLTTIVSAKEIYNKEVKDGEEIIIDGQKIRLSYQEQSGRVFVLREGETSFSVQTHICVTKDLYEYCIDDVKIKEEIRKEGDKTIYEENAYIEFKVLKKEPQISLKILSEKKFLINEEPEITIEIKNSGNLRSEEIKFEMEIPEKIYLTKRDINQHNNILSWTLRVNSDQTETTSIKAKAREVGNYTMQGEITYVVNNERITQKEKINLEFINPYKVSADEKHLITEVGAEFYHLINISSLEKSETLNTNIIIEAPEGITIQGMPSGFKKNNNIIEANQVLQPGEEKSFEIKMFSREKNNYEIKTKIKGISDSLNIEEEYSRNIGVGTSPIEIVFNIPEQVEENKNETIKVSIKNLHKENIDVSIRVLSEMIDNLRLKETITAEETKKILEEKIKFDEGNKEITVFVEYRYNNRLESFAKTKIIEVVNINKTIAEHKEQELDIEEEQENEEEKQEKETLEKEKTEQKDNIVTKIWSFITKLFK